MDLQLAYNLSIIIGAILFIYGVNVAIRALKGSIKEIELLAEIDEDKIRESVEEEITDSPYISILGALIAGLVSASIVGLYGVNGVFMYLGPLSAFVSAVGVIVCFFSDLRDAQKVEKEHKEFMGESVS